MPKFTSAAAFNLARASSRRLSYELYLYQHLVIKGQRSPISTPEERGFLAGYNEGFADGAAKVGTP